MTRDLSVSGRDLYAAAKLSLGVRSILVNDRVFNEDGYDAFRAIFYFFLAGDMSVFIFGRVCRRLCCIDSILFIKFLSWG